MRPFVSLRKISVTALICAFCSGLVSAQKLSGIISDIDTEIEVHQSQVDALQIVSDSLKLIFIMDRMEKIGWPSDGEVIKHSAMALEYDEEHEMARWVQHMIITDVIEGRTSRTNDFRVDPKISTGSSEESDYFAKKTVDDKTVYDGFGYDRGHLAASADFRWNQKALSETYYYSNMTPQSPEFNREAWAEVEMFVRDYVFRNVVDLYVVTGPVLESDLPKQSKSKNAISIPRQHYKVAIDLTNQRGIAFLMTNEKAAMPIENYMITIDEVEAVTGLNFFPTLTNEEEAMMETKFDYAIWMPEKQKKDVPMLKASELSKGQYNTQKAYSLIDSKSSEYICGTVVDTHRSGKNNVFLNLDKSFPNSVFSVSIWSSNAGNFSYSPEVELLGKKICVKGDVRLQDGVPTMNIESEKQILLLEIP